MEKTFIVHGRNLEEALDRAAVVLHCPKERLAYEIAQEPRPGRYGQPGVPCKLRVTPVAPSVGEMVAAHGHDPLWDVDVPLSAEELAALPSASFLKALGDAVARDLADSGIATAQAARRPAARRVIEGGVGQASGTIDHVGDLHIRGGVRKGARVRATGAIRVEGGVETAFLDAGDDITVADGLLGTARSAGGAVRCRFAQGAQIEALCGDVVIAESAMHCHIRSGCGVRVGDILLGGTCYGEDLVEVRVAGSESGLPTLLLSGHNRRLLDEIERIRERARSHVGRLAEIDAVQGRFLPPEAAGQRVPPEDRGRLWRAAVRRSRLNADLRRLSQQKSALLGMINVERGSRICVADRVYPGVRIGIDDAGLEVQKVTQYATFSKDYESGELRTTPYH